MRSILFQSIVISALTLTPLLAQAHAKEVPPADRVSLEKARETAISAFHGKVQGEELEFEGGKWIYSFDLKSANDKRVHEIHVDAITGKLLDAHTESAADERREKEEDMKETKN